MTYDPNIPQANDLISDSQSEILSNFSTADNAMNQNHIPFSDNSSDANGPNRGKHKFLQMPVQAGPGPVTSATEGGVQTQLVGARNELFYRYGANGPQTQLTFIKAWVVFQTALLPVLQDSYNIASVTNSAAGVYDIVFGQALTNGSYAVIANITTSPGNFGFVGPTSRLTTGFTINTLNSAGVLANQFEISCAVIGT